MNFTGSTTQTTTYGYNNGNQLTGYGGTWTDGYLFEYDSNGNQVRRWFEDDETLYNHNRENRLTSVQQTITGSTVSYTYDALGRRIMRTDPQGNKVRYWCDGLGILLTKEKPSGASAWRTKQIYTLKQAALGHIISERTNTAWNAQGAATAWGDKWFHFDLLGNTTGEIGPDGSVTTQVDMEAFGTVLSGGQNGYRLTTKQYDPDAGLYYFNARWYLPSPSRWLEEEPSAMDGPNLYMFVQGNPIIYCDLDGLVSVDALVARNHVITPKIGPSPSSGLHCFFDVDGDEVSFNGKRVVRINRHRMGWGIGGAYKDCDSNCLMRYINGSMRGLGPDDYDKRNYNCCHWVTEGMRNCCRYEPLDRYTDMRRRGL